MFWFWPARQASPESIVAADSLKEAELAYDRGDYTKAAHLFSPLAEQGVASAQFYLGLMHEKGRGVWKDVVRALMWYHIAGAMLNDDEGKTGLMRRDHLTSQMTAPQIEQAQEMARSCQQSEFKECD
jgi:TPR repeat protein